MTDLRRTILVVPPDQQAAMNAAVAEATSNPANDRTFTVPVYEDPSAVDEDGNNSSDLIGYVASWDFEGTGFDAAATLAILEAAPAAEEIPKWVPGVAVSVDDAVWHNSTVYEVVQAHTTQAEWAPDTTPALWNVRRVTSGETPDPWVQPAGAHDAYGIGDRVTHNGQTWESTHDNNVWEPDVFGWVNV